MTKSKQPIGLWLTQSSTVAGKKITDEDGAELYAIVETTAKPGVTRQVTAHSFTYQQALNTCNIHNASTRAERGPHE
jgi:hypothetical protein